MSRSELTELLETDPESFLDHERPQIRRMAVVRIAQQPPGDREIALLGRTLTDDPDPEVRAEAAEALGAAGARVVDLLLRAGDDSEARVVEAVITALGRVGDARAVGWLIETARGAAETLVREAAVAALGEIGEERAVPVLLELLKEGPPQVRRRAVVALTVFDDPRVEPAIAAARLDRNPMVKEAAEMVLGRNP